MSDPRDPNLQMALYFYSLGAYPRLERLTGQQVREVSEELLDFTSMEPLARQDNGQFPEREIPHVGTLTLVQAMAWLVAILVMRQYEIEGPEWLADKSPLLEPGIAAYQVHRPQVQGRLI